MLHNFGGNRGLYGNLPHIATAPLVRHNTNRKLSARDDAERLAGVSPYAEQYNDRHRPDDGSHRTKSRSL